MKTEIKDQEKSLENQNHDESGHVHGPNCNHHHHNIAPIVRETTKVGRDDECPCGSKQKFKKCCGR